MITQTDVRKIKNELEDTFASKDDLIQFKDEILSEIIKLRDDITVKAFSYFLIQNIPREFVE